jgi:hypothetical protein
MRGNGINCLSRRFLRTCPVLNEIKAVVKDLAPESEPTPEEVLIQKCSKLGQQLLKSSSLSKIELPEIFSSVIESLL